MTSRQQLIFQRFVESQKPQARMTPDEAETMALHTGEPLPLPVFDPLPDLRRLNIPGLWLFGDQDWSVAPRSSIAVLQSLADSGKNYDYRLVVGAGHVIVGERPQELWRNVDEWLSWILANP